MTRRLRFIVPLLLVIAAALGWGAAGVDWTQLDPDAVTERLRAAGPLAPLALLALLVLQCVIAPLPSEPLMMAAGYLFGPIGGFALSWLGVTVGASACFVLAAGFGRSFALRFVDARKLADLDSRISARGLVGIFSMLLVIRLVAFSSFDMVSYACGLLGVPFGWFLLASAVGVIPKVFAFTYLGTNMTEIPTWLSLLLAFGTFGIVLTVPWVLRARRRLPSPELP